MRIIPAIKDWTVERAIDYVIANRDDGVECPVCGKFTKVYKWSLYSTAAQELILMYRLGGARKPVYVGDLAEYGYKGHGDTTRLKNWGLVEAMKEHAPGTGRAGKWMLTQLGVDFVEGRATIPKKIYVCNDKILRSEGPEIDIRHALGKRFVYEELLTA